MRINYLTPEIDIKIFGAGEAVCTGDAVLVSGLDDGQGSLTNANIKSNIQVVRRLQSNAAQAVNIISFKD